MRVAVNRRATKALEEPSGVRIEAKVGSSLIYFAQVGTGALFLLDLYLFAVCSLFILLLFFLSVLNDYW